MLLLNLTLGIYLTIGVLLSLAMGLIGWLALDPDWVEQGEPDGDDSVAERRETRTDLLQSLDLLPGKDTRGALIVFCCVLVVAWPWALVVTLTRKD